MTDSFGGLAEDGRTLGNSDAMAPLLMYRLSLALVCLKEFELIAHVRDDVAQRARSNDEPTHHFGCKPLLEYDVPILVSSNDRWGDLSEDEVECILIGKNMDVVRVRRLNSIKIDESGRWNRRRFSVFSRRGALVFHAYHLSGVSVLSSTISECPVIHDIG